jgi:hypothetical protein
MSYASTTQADRETAAKLFAAERAFRRGYHQALTAVNAAIDAGATSEELKAFEQLVATWRQGPAFRISPPEIAIGGTQ